MTRPTRSRLILLVVGTMTVVLLSSQPRAQAQSASTLDLAVILITEGFAFAAFTKYAKPVCMPTLVTELAAKNHGAGLWAPRNRPHPNLILFGVAKSDK